MDTRTLFKKISQKMRVDFETSAQIKHSGSKGTVRENCLRNFLAEGRLPAKYGLGTGEIVGRVRNTSRQCDVIVYDKLNGVTLLYDESVQVFPVDCVYGVIEVKSSLSKAELIDALSKIKSIKEMAPGGTVSQHLPGGFTLFHARSRPFGIIFAYRLADNSLDSLLENLREWEKEMPPSVWPNYVCVLETGVIYHHGKSFKSCMDSDEISDEAAPIALHHLEDSLFQFYCALHDMCGHMSLGPVELMQYYEPAIQVGRFVIRGRVEGQLIKNGEVVPDSLGRFTEAAIEKIVKWCDERGAMTYGDILLKQFGSIPDFIDVNARDRQVFFYNPDNLPGLHELEPGSIRITEKGPVFPPCLVNPLSFDIDGRSYMVAMSGFEESDFEDAGDVLGQE